MVYGTGIDIIEIDRIKEAIDRNRKIISRVFTPSEIRYFEERKYNIDTIAGYFTAKEAVLKAVGTGLAGFKWKDIEIYKNGAGKPCIRLFNNLYKYCKDKKIDDILISISHSRYYAVAHAIAIYEEGYNEGGNATGDVGD